MTRHINITGTIVNRLFTLQCPYLLRQELFGNPAEKVDLDSTPEGRMLAQYGNAHEQAVIAKLAGVHEPIYEKGNLDEGHAETMRLMHDGAAWIYQGVLLETPLLNEYLRPLWEPLGPLPLAPRFVGIPDLLQRVKLPSLLGPNSYIPGDVKSSKVPRLPQQMQVAYYAWLLEYIQGRRPEKGFIIPASGQPEYFDIDVVMPQVQELVEEELPESILEPPDCYHLTARCRQCSWLQHCMKRAHDEGDLSLIPGLRRSQKQALHRAGIRTVAQAATMELPVMPVVRGLGEAGLVRIREQAKAMTTGKMILRAQPGLPRSSVDLVIDLEGDPFDDGSEYLFGLLRRDGRTQRVEQFVATRRQDEAATFHSFLARIERILDEARLSGQSISAYCFGSYEKCHLSALASRYGDPASVVDRLLESMIDLYGVIRNSLILPLESYSLKEVARLPQVSFARRDQEASADLSMVWHQCYLADGDTKWLDRIKMYNEDDLRATLAVVDWLVSLG